jgi:hypothetical protein
LTEYIEGLSPIKVYEYLAAGKAVVSTPVPSVAELGVVRIAEGAAEFVREVEAALFENDDESVAHRIEVAKRHTWDAKLQHILELVPELKC